MDKYNRKRYVADHAIERLRERWAKMPSHRHRNDPDLANLIDSVVDSAIGAGRVELFEAPTEAAILKVVNVGEELQDALYAIVLPNRARGKGAPSEAITSLLTSDMVQRSRMTEKWRPYYDTPAKNPHAARTNLGELMGKVELPTPAPPPPQIVVPSTQAPPTRAHLISFCPLIIADDTTEEGDEQFEVVDEHGLAERIAKLTNDRSVSPGTVRVWREVRYKARTVIDLEG